MGHGKKIKRPKETKAWKILDGTYKKRDRIIKESIERLVAAIQEDCYWDQRDIDTWDQIQQGNIDWSGDVRSKRRTRKHIRKRS